MCDNCNSSAKTTRVALLTGKRGRPPQKDYCEDCQKSLAGTFKLPGEKLVKAEKSSASTSANGHATVRTLAGFDSAALFLLGLNYENLFEQVSCLDQYIMRCKGCGTVLKRPERELHFRNHKQAYTGKIPVTTTTEVDDDAHST